LPVRFGKACRIQAVAGHGPTQGCAGIGQAVILLKAHSRAADVTTVTEPRPDSVGGDPGPRPDGSRPLPDSPVSVSSRSEPVELLLRKFRARSLAAQAQAGPPRREASGPGPGPPPHQPPADVAPPAQIGVVPGPAAPSGAPESEWTFHPDRPREPVEPDPVPTPGLFIDPQDLAPRPSAMVPRVGVVVIVAALLVGALALTRTGPFHSPSGVTSTPPTLATTASDVRGTWNVLAFFAGAFQVETMTITTENRSSGTFTGVIVSPVGVETMKGTVVGTTVSFTLTFGTSSDSGSATLSNSDDKVRMQGAFSTTSGGHGSIIATRTST